MVPRFHVDHTLRAGASFVLPRDVARHVQVLRLQPGAAITLFDGSGGEWDARIVSIGRADISVELGIHHATQREWWLPVTLAIGMPANDRMDMLVEKATELGVAAIQPLMSERSVLRLAGERAERKLAHLRGVATAACEQSGRTRVPQIAPVRGLIDWLPGLPPSREGSLRLILNLREALPLQQVLPSGGPSDVIVLSGPEGGFTPAEVAAACDDAGFMPVTLGERVLRADTAPLAVLAQLAALRP
jgi:16S rRNA (uracil1498-N3)-methyltransferase